MRYQVLVRKKVAKSLPRLPREVQESFRLLAEDLRRKGPVRKQWPNYSKLGKLTHHCHLRYRWVAVWTEDEDDKLILEVNYVGSREKAPY
jgi:mRNA-degrading endonuclease RelE of RelBE toxin-antitoxin system